MRRVALGLALLCIGVGAFLAMHPSTAHPNPVGFNLWRFLSGFALVIGTTIGSIIALHRARLEDLIPPPPIWLLLRATSLVHGVLLASMSMLMASISAWVAIGFLSVGYILADGRQKANERRRRTLLSGDVHRFDREGDLRPLAESGKAIVSDEMLARLSEQEMDAIVKRQLSFAKVSGIGAFLCSALYGFIAILAKDHPVRALSIAFLVHAIGLTVLIGRLRNEADLKALRITGDAQALLTAILKLHGTRSWLAAGRVSRIAKAGRIPSSYVVRLARGPQ